MRALPCGALLAALVAAPLGAQQSAPAPAAPAAASTEAPLRVASVEGITEYRLANGLRVLLFPDPSKPTECPLPTDAHETWMLFGSSTAPFSSTLAATICVQGPLYGDCLQTASQLVPSNARSCVPKSKSRVGAIVKPVGSRIVPFAAMRAP